MGRMTKDTRESMARAIVKHAYAKKAEALVERHTALFDRVYDFAYSGEVRKAMDVLVKAEPDALPKQVYLTVNVGGLSIDIGAAFTFTPARIGTLASAKNPRSHYVLACHQRYNCRISIPDGDQKDPKLHEDIRQYADDFSALTNECSRAYSEAKAALDSFSTTKRLREGWPEVLPVIEHLLPSEERAGLPAVQVDKLNDKFGLPPEEVAA